MKSSRKKKLTLTVGITTCFGDASILTTVKSLRDSHGVEKFQFIIVSDRIPFKPWVKRKLAAYGVGLIENKGSASQTYKHRQIVKKATGDILVFTQDDVIFAPDALEKILTYFTRHPEATFVSICNEPLPATSLTEAALGIGTAINNRIAVLWNKGDNYLSVVGRCLVYQTRWIKSYFDVPDSVATTDTYHYLNTKKYRGVYHYLPDATVYFKNPQKLSEFMRKSSRFQYSSLEMSRYFGNVESFYRVPKSILSKAITDQFLASPMTSLLYFAFFFYSRLFKKPAREVLNPVWKVDISTKLDAPSLAKNYD